MVQLYLVLVTEYDLCHLYGKLINVLLECIQIMKTNMIVHLYLVIQENSISGT